MHVPEAIFRLAEIDLVTAAVSVVAVAIGLLFISFIVATKG